MPYVLWACSGKAVVEPSDYVVTCADYGMQMEGVHWASWRHGSATGSGTVSENDCQPDCADGKFIDYPADFTLTGRKWWPRYGRYSYTAITVHYPAAAPAVYRTVNGKIVVTHPHTFTWPPSGVPA